MPSQTGPYLCRLVQPLLDLARLIIPGGRGVDWCGWRPIHRQAHFQPPGELLRPVIARLVLPAFPVGGGAVFSQRRRRHRLPNLPGIRRIREPENQLGRCVPSAAPPFIERGDGGGPRLRCGPPGEKISDQRAFQFLVFRVPGAIGDKTHGHPMRPVVSGVPHHVPSPVARQDSGDLRPEPVEHRGMLPGGGQRESGVPLLILPLHPHHDPPCLHGGFDVFE